MIHRPTITKDFLKCPMYWRLKQLWEPKASQWTPYKLMGTAIHAGVHDFWEGISNDDPPALLAKEAHEKAQAVLQDNFIEQDKWTLEGWSKLVSKGLAKALESIPGHVHWATTEDLIGSELDLDHCHPDLVTRDKLTKKLI